MATRKGTSGTDTLSGTDNNDFLLGAGGDDALTGGGGDDTLEGGIGDDNLNGGAGKDRLYGGEGDDRISGGASSDALSGGIGDDVENGGSGDDLMVGGSGQDYLLGGSGNDKLQWDPRDFLINGGVGFDTLNVLGKTLVLVGATNLRAIEAIDMHDRGANTLRADAASVVNATETPHLLRIFGDRDDALELTGSWNRVRSSVAGFTRYTSGSAKIDVEDAVAVTFGNHMNLANLNGVNGVHINGANVLSTHPGDVNGDGFDDLLLGAPTNPHSDDGGNAYVIFGRASGIATTLDLDHLKARQGMRLTGFKGEHDTGSSVSIVGDLNHDGFDDIAVRAGDYSFTSGQVLRDYVVFGHGGSFPTSFAMSKVNGDNGYIIDGFPLDDPNSGNMSLNAAGDFNGDGFDDFAIGMPFTSQIGVVDTGSAFVLFGTAAPYDASVDIRTMPPTEVWRINGAAQFQNLGQSLASGDINGDGFDDLLMASAGSARSSYVVFGKATGFDSALSVGSLNGTNGFAIVSAHTGWNITSLDINGDGYDDVVMQDAALGSNSVRVVFGHGGSFSSTVSASALDGNNGFTITAPAIEEIGTVMASAGDVNGDGYEDLLLGAPHATSSRQAFAGATYVVFGHGGGFDPQLNLAQLDIHQGLRIDGYFKNQFSGASVSGVGDVNGDGYDDIAIAGFGLIGTPNGIPPDGSYVIYGRDFSHDVEFEGTIGNDVLTGTAANESLVGGRGNDVLDGAGGSDALLGASGNDILVWDAADHRIDGGSGFDTLRIDGADQTLDLTLLPSKMITGINVVDLTGSGDNHLRLSLQDLLQLSDHSALRVNGNAGDSVEVTTTGWTPLVDQNVAGNSYHAYFNGSATLLIDTDITQTVT